MDHWSQMLSGYGVLVMVKAVLTLALAPWGWHTGAGPSPGCSRRDERRGTAWRIVAGETIIMASTMAVATALARTAPRCPRNCRRKPPRRASSPDTTCRLNWCPRAG
ncbi:hypothetical protein [Arthrobacter sp.]|uniref:hypothetical protein n=1 Tax=Arthrobacter sp. TaxID=1667 RepID=UPI003A94D1BF